MKRKTLEKLASEKSSPCVTISMNTHRTHPDNLQDAIVLRNLLKEAQARVIKEFGKRFASSLIEKFSDLEREVDINSNLDSLHIFLSGSTKEIVKSVWPTPQNTVHVAENFAVKPLIKDFIQMEEYLVLLLSQSGVTLFHAMNDTITGEIRNDDFPFAKNPHFLTDPNQLSDSKQVDNMVREFLNHVDKALVSVYHKTTMSCVVICTEDNYSRLMQVADIPSMYYGYARINYNDTASKTIAAEAWPIVQAAQKHYRDDMIMEMQEAVGQGKAITDLTEIYQAVQEGRGDLFIASDDFHQGVRMTGAFSFELVNDVTLPGVIDDITNEIAWQVISKKGRVMFTNQEETKSFGDIALKVRY